MFKLSTYGFPRAEQDIGNELSAGRGEGKTDGSVLWLVITSGGSVDILEDFVETELSETLSGVSNKSWGPSECESSESLSGLDGSESVSDAGVKTWHSLHSALDDIEWANQSVGDSAGKDSSHHAFLVVTEVVNV